MNINKFYKGVTTSTQLSIKMLFCDDIKRYIVSFLGAKPMKTADMFKMRTLIDDWRASADCLYGHKILTYRLRKRFSLEQFQFELSDVGHQSRKKYIQKWGDHFKREDVMDELAQYHKNEEGVFRIPDSYPQFQWLSNIVSFYFLDMKHQMKCFLKDIRSAGAISAKKHRGRERVVCPCCNVSLARNSLSRHRKTFGH